jgi:ankyrin repeat protein
VRPQSLKSSTRFDTIPNGEEQDRQLADDELNNNSYVYANKNDTQGSDEDKSFVELQEKIRQSIRQKNLEKFKFLFESNKLDPDLVMTKTANWNLLMYAVSNGTYDICKYLLENGADPTYTDDSFSLLMCACACEDSHVLESELVNIVELLLEYNADVNQTDK